jgi:ABC-type transport system involved in multi-copper enzyme maturation permease subunit
VRLQSNFTTDKAGSSSGAPRWLKLTRTGSTVTAYESADGQAWTTVGSVKLRGLSQQVQIGLFVASPDAVKVERQFGGETIDSLPTDGKASFTNVSPAGGWQDLDRSVTRTPGDFSITGDQIVLTGSGDIGPDKFGEDTTKNTLSGAMVGMIAIVSVSVLFITAEYKRGMIGLTFAASPRRGRVLAAKSVVLGAAAFVLGLIAALGSFVLAAPLQHSKNLTTAPLFEAPVLRAIFGTGLLLAIVAVFTLAVATILRRSAATITIVLVALLLPQIIGTGLPLSTAQWLERLTPAAGFAIQQTVERSDTAIGPWAGLGVLCVYTAVALAVATRQLKRRDA